MRRSISLMVVAAVVLTSCGTVRESRFNPFNWFGRSQSEPVTGAEEVNPLIPQRSRASVLRLGREETVPFVGSLVGEVTELLVEQRPGGAILRATGVADNQGPFDIRLIKDDAASSDTVLAYEFRALQLPGPRGGETSRTVTVARTLTDNDLRGVRQIRVSGARNSRVTRR